MPSASAGASAATNGPARADGDAMKPSFVMCSNRTGLEVVSRIGRLAALASDEIEIVVRDNSGDPEKQDSLARMQGPNRKIVSVDPCASWGNMLGALSLATGDYIFEIHDDDDLNVIAMPGLLRGIRDIDNDPSYVAVAGFYVLELGAQSVLYSLEDFDAPTGGERVGSFVKSAYSVLHFSAIRRSVRTQLDDFNRSLPFRFAYLDQIQAVLLLSLGRFRTVRHVLYTYDMHNWADPVQARRTDLKYYKDNGVDGSVLQLQYLLQGFEGAKAIAEKFLPLPLTAAERLDIAHRWFGHKYSRFADGPVAVDETARFNREAQALAGKWKSRPEFDFAALLTDLSEFFALSDPAAGQRYYDFWK